MTTRSAKKARRQQDILLAALHVFSRDGFSAARTDDVAEEAGVSKGTLYLYFKSKEDMFKAVIEDNLRPVLDEATKLSLEGKLSAEEQLTTMLKFFYENVLNTERRQILRLVIAEGPNFPDIAKFHYENIIAPAQALTKDLIAKGVASGEFRDIPGDYLTKAIVGSALAAGLWKTVFDEMESIDLGDYCQTHIDMLLGGLRAKP